jgi:dolichol-phosphate mannosyltransferase
MARVAGSRVIALHRDTRGIFTAIKDGIAVCRGEILVFMDADLSHPANMIPRLVEEINGHDLVSASRFVKGGKLISSRVHRLLSKALNKVCEVFLWLSVKDLTGGFHAIKKSKFNGIEFKYDSKWGEFDLELFYRAKKDGMRIKEIPFVYKFRDFGTSKSNDFVYGWKYLLMAVKLRFFG